MSDLILTDCVLCGGKGVLGGCDREDCDHAHTFMFCPQCNSQTTETLPDGPFFAERVDLEAAWRKLDALSGGFGPEIEYLRAAIKAALVGVEPAEQEERGGFVPSDWHQQRYVTRWKETQ